MRLDFLLLALPRSGTTWAANWLTTEHSICWHDPVQKMSPYQADERITKKTYRGIACTASWMWSNWLRGHPGRILLLDRSTEEVNVELVQLGLPTMLHMLVREFRELPYRRMDYRALFEDPEAIWRYLLPELPFDEERHEELTKMLIQPLPRALIPDASRVNQACEELRRERC